MSQENVEIVRAALAAWNADDMDALRELYDPDVILRAPEGWLEPGPWVGQEAVIREWEYVREGWNANIAEPISDFIDVGERVAVRLLWRSKGQGPDLNMEVTAVYTFRKGKIFLQQQFWDHDEALETLGLSEQDAHADS